jgi:hypothetical protein
LYIFNKQYEGQDNQVYWCGVSIKDDDKFNLFLSQDVTARLYDTSRSVEFEAYLRGIANTGFAQDSLDAILAAEVPEERDWAVSEAIAEAYLAYAHDITWPWNMKRDKRNPNASLPGADLIGFLKAGETVHLVLGEVKSSADRRSPPNVMNGRSGMIHQIDELANNLSRIVQLLKWLLPRCKNTEYEELFQKAVALLLDSGNKATSLFGVLVRDTHANELDLRGRGQSLSKLLQFPTRCHLIALYLPCSIADLPSRVPGGAS